METFSGRWRREFPFRKRSLPFETVDAISQNGRCHLKRSMPFLRTVVAISPDGRCHRKGRCQEGTDISDSLRQHA